MRALDLRLEGNKEALRSFSQRRVQCMCILLGPWAWQWSMCWMKGDFREHIMWSLVFLDTNLSLGKRVLLWTEALDRLSQTPQRTGHSRHIPTYPILPVVYYIIQVVTFTLNNTYNLGKHPGHSHCASTYCEINSLGEMDVWGNGEKLNTHQMSVSLGGSIIVNLLPLHSVSIDLYCDVWGFYLY